MRAIDKFILHVVHNWKNELNEAYSEGAIKAFIKKFSEEADDLNITVSDNQLRKYIERFDVLKNSPKITEKDLNKYSIGQLIRLVTSSPGAEVEEEEEEDRTPDVVYQGNGITIWNGSKEENCIRYGAGESWCITRTSWASHRYSADKGYPTFYLAKNNNLSDSDKLSFIVIAVRDPNLAGGKRYVLHNRTNRPHYPDPITFSELLNQAPWLRDIPNIESILKYIKLSNQEKANQIYERNSITIREWIKLPFTVKKQYLVARKDKDLFKDITSDEFTEKYLPKYPDLANFIATTPDIIKPIALLKNLDKFNNQDRRSITSNLFDTSYLSLEYLTSEVLPFDVKKLLTILNKWNISSNERMYVTKDGKAIVKLKFGEDISVNLYTAEDDYPNIKLNQRTAKYLLDYPELDKLPFNSLIKLATDGVISNDFIKKVIETAKSEDNSAIVVKPVEDGEILIDSNSFASYKIQDGKITKVPFNDEEVQKVFAAEKENTSFQQGAIDLVKTSISTRSDLPPTLDKEAFLSIIKATPYDKRKFSKDGDELVILVPDGASDISIFAKSIDPYNSPFLRAFDFGRRSDWTSFDYSNSIGGEAEWKAYFAWMRNENKTYNSNDLIRAWRNSMNTQSKKDWFAARPPFDQTDRYAPIIAPNGMYCLVNKANPRESLRLSDSGKLIKLSIPTSTARQLLGTTPGETTPTTPGVQAPVAGRRGRPAGGGTPRATAPSAPAAAGDINVSEVMDETGLLTAFLRLPRPDYRRLNVTTGRRVAPNGDRGAARRNNQLGGAGSVGRIIAVGDSKIYFIRLANQRVIASINVQPGNRNYVLLDNESGNIMVPLNSPSELMSVLQQRNLAEVRNYLIREYITNNPQHTNEVRKMIQKHIAETKK
jgi:hypothetical protein